MIEIIGYIELQISIELLLKNMQKGWGGASIFGSKLNYVEYFEASRKWNKEDRRVKNTGQEIDLSRRQKHVMG